MKSLLLVYYHPVIFDLAETFNKIFDEITIAVNTSLKDNYGTSADVINSVKSNSNLSGVDCVPLPLALQKIKSGAYDLVGCDGVFDGDKLVMDTCKQNGVPWFCINGYPHNFDEPSQNILSFSWFLPQIQYKRDYPAEGHIKEVDWKNIVEKGRSDGKNICVFYPEMNDAKRFVKGKEDPPFYERLCKLYSFIHRFEECNKWSYKLFQKLKKESWEVENYSGLSQHEVYKKMWNSSATILFKHGDCPGISLLESLVLGRPVATMTSFVKASFNQEVLIDGFNSIIADEYDELEKRLFLYEDFLNLNPDSIRNHAHSLTSFERQRHKLERFFERCITD